MLLVRKIVPLFLSLGMFFVLAQGQEKKNQKPAPEKTTETKTGIDDPASSEKKNGRPAVQTDTAQKGSGNDEFDRSIKYIYEFERPDFSYPHILIEHDDSGNGRISFTKTGWEERMEDPIELSGTTMRKLRQAFNALDFLNSDEVYQVGRDHSNLGEISITLRNETKERTVKFNWSDVKNAKFLMDEYRRIANEYIWLFEFAIARENQPLHTPGLIDVLDSYLRRKEISDPPRLLPILAKYSDDERLPLIARNRAAKLLKQIEKDKK